MRLPKVCNELVDLETKSWLLQTCTEQDKYISKVPSPRHKMLMEPLLIKEM